MLCYTELAALLIDMVLAGVGGLQHWLGSFWICIWVWSRKMGDEEDWPRFRDDEVPYRRETSHGVERERRDVMLMRQIPTD